MPLKTSKKLILASQSPRRQQILRDAGFDFITCSQDTDESFSPDVEVEKLPVLLAARKYHALEIDKKPAIVICADTVVVANNNVILNKPVDATEAKQMLWQLSNATHRVITGVCIGTDDAIVEFSDTAFVTFKPLTDQEIDFYINTYQPFDKAGAYGVQEFMGMIGITHIEGSFYTIMGLPIQKVYETLNPYIVWDV